MALKAAMRCDDNASEKEALPAKIAKRLFASATQQEACVRHLSPLLVENKEPLTPKVLRALRQDAIALTMATRQPTL